MTWGNGNFCPSSSARNPFSAPLSNPAGRIASGMSSLVGLLSRSSRRWLQPSHATLNAHCRGIPTALRGCAAALPNVNFASNPPHKVSTRSYIAVDSKRKLDIMNATKEQTDAADEPGANQAIRPKLRVSDILDTMEQRNFTIDQHATVLDAISHLVNEKIASALVVNDESEILGIFTARDILKCIQQQNMSTEYRQRRTNFLTDISIKELMTPKQQLVYCSPSDSSRRCREIMFQCKIRSLPVIDHGEVKGIITAKHLADASFNLKDTGGKKGFIHNVTGRRGLPTGTKINQQALQKRAEHLRQNASAQLDMDIASFALPHPFKRAEGVAMSRRLYGADELSTDLSVCEDAHFALKIVDPLLAPAHAAGTDAEPPAGGWGDDASYLSSSSGAASSAAASSHSHIYLCVADGVGSWRQFGVDPRAYSHRLVENARKVVESDMQHRELIRHSPFDRDLDPVHPLDVIMDAWNMTNSEGVVGSSTICVATLDKKLGQLSYSNVGDCGLLVIRQIGTDVLGYMHQAQQIGAGYGGGSSSGAAADSGGLHIAYLSQQQLRSFNLPYQLGFSDRPDTPNSFESPSDADTASISVMPGDVVILATDGLFDNMDLDEIVKEVAAWERGDKAQQVRALAEQLVQKARLLSLDKNRDSPFALLAKENDIMWGGGMPDDTTVVVARVTRSSSPAT